MVDTQIVRTATVDDVDFIAETICSAEKGGSERLSYCTIFGWTEEQFMPVLKAMLEEDIEGQELCISDFMIAELNGRPAAACCAWIEGESGLSSAILKASVLLDGVESDRMQAAQQHFKLLEKLYIMRDKGAVQIESVYVQAGARGMGLAGRLIDAQIARLSSRDHTGYAQVILAANNAAAHAAYSRAGFSEVRKVSSDDQALLALLPSTEKMLMQRSL